MLMNCGIFNHALPRVSSQLYVSVSYMLGTIFTIEQQVDCVGCISYYT